MIYPMYKGRSAFIIGTGPSLTKDVIDKINCTRILKFGVNNTWKIFDLDVFHACNADYWRLYWDTGLYAHRAQKWTSDKDIQDKYSHVFYIPHDNNQNAGLSRNPSFVHRHHGSGPQLINIAYHYGITKMLLVGWDMRYPGKVDRYHYTRPRHYYGDDPLSEKHFPMTGPNGEFTGLIKEMETIKPADYGIQIFNCTQNSAMKCFPFWDLDDAIKAC